MSLALVSSSFASQVTVSAVPVSIVDGALAAMDGLGAGGRCPNRPRWRHYLLEAPCLWVTQSVQCRPGHADRQRSQRQPLCLAASHYHRCEVVSSESSLHLDVSLHHWTVQVGLVKTVRGVASASMATPSARRMICRHCPSLACTTHAKNGNFKPEERCGKWEGEG